MQRDSEPARVLTRGRRPRRVASAWLGPLAVLALILVGNATASGLPVTLQAPFHGSAAFLNDSAWPPVPGACASGTIPGLPTWHPSTGRIAWSVAAKLSANRTCQANTRFCRSPSSNGCLLAAAGAGTKVLLPFPAPNRTAQFNVAVRWTLNVSGAWGFVRSACPKVILSRGAGQQYCEVLVGAWVAVNDPGIADLTTGYFDGYPGFTAVSAGTQSNWYLDRSCSGGGCTVSTGFSGPSHGQFTYRVSFSTYLNYTYLYPNHVYALQLYVSGWAAAAVVAQPQPWNVTAATSLDMATHGNGLTLDSVSIT